MRRPSPANQFSFSKVKAFQQCPLRYRYRYIEGYSEAFRSIESFVGTVAHAVLEWTYQERDDGKAPTPAQAAERFSRTWDELWDGTIAVVRLTDTASDHLQRGREMVSRFVQNVLARDTSTTVGLERRFTVHLDDGVVFTGIADRVGLTAKGTPFVVDYKTSASGGTYGEAENGLQARLYAACLLRQYPTATAARAGFHYLATGETRWETVRPAHDGSIWGRFLALVRAAADAVDHPPRPGVLCAWCGFNAICPAAQVPEKLSGGLELAQRLKEPFPDRSEQDEPGRDGPRTPGNERLDPSDDPPAAVTDDPTVSDPPEKRPGR